jgi:hypothetical protein
MTRAHDAVKIAGNFTIGDWKELRKTLVKQYGAYSKDWDTAVQVFVDRIKSRFFTPIDEIMKRNLNQGNGFTIRIIDV